MLAIALRTVPALAAGVLLATQPYGCKYLVAVDTTGGNIFFAFSSGHAAGPCLVRVVTAGGATVRDLDVADANARTVSWDLKDARGNRVPGGTYSARMIIDGVVVDEAPPVQVPSP